MLLLETIMGAELIPQYWAKPESCPRPFSVWFWCKNLCGDAQPLKRFLLWASWTARASPQSLSPQMRISGVEIISDLDTVFILLSLPRLKHQTQLSLICKQESLPPLFTPVLAFPNSFYLCSCAVQEESCQCNIHYYSDKNRVAFTSISRGQHNSVLQNSIKNRREEGKLSFGCRVPKLPFLAPSRWSLK